jgi:branched-chain amino acid transport system ATP-binding protein
MNHLWAFLPPLWHLSLNPSVNSGKKTGTPSFWSNRNIRDSLTIAHRAYVLEEGKIILEGEGRQLLNSSHIKEVYLGL